MDGRRDDVGRPGLLVLDGAGRVWEQELLRYGAEAVVSWLTVLYFRMSSEQESLISYYRYYGL